MPSDILQSRPTRSARPKLLFVVTEDWYFWSHRLPIARSALQNGYEVVVATRVNSLGEQISAAGFRLLPIHLNRSSYSPFEELRSIWELRSIYRSEKPDIVHHVALKPILYGSIAAMGKERPLSINALAGLGYLVSSNSLKARILRPVIWKAFRFLLNRPKSHVLLQNEADQSLLITEVGISADRTTVIRGSGVDAKSFRPAPEPSGTPVVLLSSRMLWIKGIEDFVKAASALRARGIDARFVLAGDTDPGSPGAIPREKLQEWQKSGAVEWWGHQESMPKTLQFASLVCLPSHGGEGVPKSLLEAAAAGRAIVTTDVPGCTDIVRHEVNGLLVKPRDPEGLAQAMESLLKAPQVRARMGECGREIAVNEFSEERVVQQTLALYAKLLRSQSPDNSKAFPAQTQ